MKKIFIAVALLAAAPLFAKYKVKQKSFEAVVVHDVCAITGRYVGIEGDFEIELNVDANGRVGGVLIRDHFEQPLKDVVIDGAELRSDLVHATFGDRVLNGDHAFGLKVTRPQIKFEDVLFENLFCKKK